MRRLLGIVLTVVVCLSWAQLAAHADEDDWAITRYDMTMVAERDGSIAVTLDFDFDFADEAGHGPFLTLPNRLEVAGDPDRWRVLDISDVTASSSSGAPADVQVDEDAGVVEVRIGDESQEVTGVQSYQVTFVVDGVVNPDVDGHDEISWNAVAGFEVPISNASVTLEGPDRIDRAECVAGKRNATSACQEQQLTDNRVQWQQDAIAPGDGMTVTAAFPAGTFPGVEPQFSKRLHVGNVLAVTPATAGTAGAIAVLGVGAVGLIARRRGRDEAWTGLTPGVTPQGGSSASVGARDASAPVAVRFTPPDDTRPAEVGTLLAEKAGMKEVSATLVDLAVRGYLRIQDEDGNDKRLIKLRGPEGLAPFERELFDGVFRERHDPRISKITTMHTTASATTSQLNDVMTERGWFRADPRLTRGIWYGLGGVTVAVGAIVALLVGALTGWGLVGVAIGVVGLALLIAAQAMPSRTAAGSAVLAQAQGFRTYLQTAEADQLKFEEGEDIFSKYLPYAIVFGVAQRWTKVCAELAAAGRLPMDTGWYIGPYVLLANPTAFANDLAGLSDSMTSALTSANAASMASAGGSGFGGGVGGGIGGVGGGGW